MGRAGRMQGFWRAGCGCNPLPRSPADPQRAAQSRHPQLLLDRPGTGLGPGQVEPVLVGQQVPPRGPGAGPFRPKRQERVVGRRVDGEEQPDRALGAVGVDGGDTPTDIAAPSGFATGDSIGS